MLLTAAVAAVGLAAFPVENGETALGNEWLKAPLAGIVDALGTHLPDLVADALLVYVGLTGALVLLAAATTRRSWSHQARALAWEHRQLPTASPPNRRTPCRPRRSSPPR